MLSRSKPAEPVLELDKPVEALVEERRLEDHLAPARGVIVGVLASVAIWAAIIAALM